LICVGSKGGAKGGVTIHQDVDLYVLRLGAEERETYNPATGRNIWVQVAWGSLSVNGETLSAGDAAALEGEASVLFEAGADTEALLFDLA
jgi:redox-sensitive bicupin YhaK (pirin superfamily)